MSVISDMVQDVYQFIQDRAAQEVDQNTSQEVVEQCEDFLISHTYEWVNLQWYITWHLYSIMAVYLVYG